uniref:Uncharacterized protein n=1 Tax=Sipha flava TaxID=143950 RepID=A0A2S2QHI4_9HEMI
MFAFWTTDSAISYDARRCARAYGCTTPSRASNRVITCARRGARVNLKIITVKSVLGMENRVLSSDVLVRRWSWTKQNRIVNGGNPRAGCRRRRIVKMRNGKGNGPFCLAKSQ